MSYELSRASRLLTAATPDELIAIERAMLTERSRLRSAVGRIRALIARAESSGRRAALRKTRELLYSPGGEQLIESIYKVGVDWRRIRDFYARNVIDGESMTSIGRSIGKTNAYVSDALKKFRVRCNKRLGWRLPSKKSSDFYAPKNQTRPVRRAAPPRVWPWRVVRPDGSIVSYHATLGAAESRAAIVGGRVESHNAPKK